MLKSLANILSLYTINALFTMLFLFVCVLGMHSSVRLRLTTTRLVIGAKKTRLQSQHQLVIR